MPNDNNIIAQLLRIYQSMNTEDRNLAYEVIRDHQNEITVEAKGETLVEGMQKYGALGPSSGGCPRCGYPN